MLRSEICVSALVDKICMDVEAFIIASLCCTSISLSYRKASEGPIRDFCQHFAWPSRFYLRKSDIHFSALFCRSALIVQPKTPLGPLCHTEFLSVSHAQACIGAWVSTWALSGMEFTSSLLIPLQTLEWVIHFQSLAHSMSHSYVRK